MNKLQDREAAETVQITNVPAGDLPRLVRLERIAARGMLHRWMAKYAPTCRPGGWDYDKDAAALCEETAELLETRVPW